MSPISFGTPSIPFINVKPIYFSKSVWGNLQVMKGMEGIKTQISTVIPLDFGERPGGVDAPMIPATAS
jgi:hypothetical protein